MLDAEISAKLVELMLSRGRALAQAKQPIGESFAVVSQHPGDLHRCCTGQITQEAPRIGSGLCWIDVHKDSSGWSAPVEWSSLNVSAWSAFGLSGRCFWALVDGNPERFVV